MREGIRQGIHSIHACLQCRLILWAAVGRLHTRAIFPSPAVDDNCLCLQNACCSAAPAVVAAVAAAALATLQQAVGSTSPSWCGLAASSTC